MSILESRSRAQQNAILDSFYGIDEYPFLENQETSFLQQKRHSQIENGKQRSSTQLLFTRAHLVKKLKAKEENNDVSSFLKRNHSSNDYKISSQENIFQQEKNISFLNESKIDNQSSKKFSPFKKISAFNCESSRQQDLDKSQMSRSNILTQNSLSDSFADLKLNNYNHNKQLQNGPRYDSKGKLVPYSLVGRPEWFITAEEINTAKKKSENETPWREKSIFQVFALKKVVQQLRQRSISTVSNSSSKKKRTTIEKGIAINKERLLVKLDACEQRIKENQAKEQQERLKMSFSERSFSQRQQRQLSLYEQEKQQWDCINNAIFDQIQRDPQNNLMVTSGHNFRQKQEKENAKNNFKTPSEILGPQFWEGTLRNQNFNHKQDNSFKQETYDKSVSQELYPSMREITSSQSGARTQVILKNNNEIIKQPKELQVQLPKNFLKMFRGDSLDQIAQNKDNKLIKPTQSLNASSKMINTFYKSRSNYSQLLSSKKYNQINTSQNLSQVENLSLNINNNQQSHILDINVDQLIIKGENKLEREKKALINDGKPNNAVYRQFNEEELLQKEAEEKLKNEIKMKFFQLEQQQKNKEFELTQEQLNSQQHEDQKDPSKVINQAAKNEKKDKKKIGIPVFSHQTMIPSLGIQKRRSVKNQE